MKFIADKAISLNGGANGAGNDLLHTGQYADILLQGIKDAPQGEAYTIGLFGEWGCGKSSVIETMTAQAAKDDALKKVKIVNYDAWKYSGDSFRRMFLFELRRALGIIESPLMQRFYVSETREAEIKTSLNWKKLGIIAAFVLVAAVLVAVLKDKYGIATAIPSGVALFALLFSLWNYVFDQLKMTIQKPLLFAPEQFEECYKEMVEYTVKWDKIKEKTLKWITFGQHHEQYQRIVIIIDNIDRCQPDKAYALLTDIKNFLCKEFDTIFVVPVDIYALRKHIVKSSTESSSIEADEFLRKFFNASIWMKTYQSDEMYDFAKSLSDKHALGYKPETISLVANEFATNPRRIIQLFNNLQIELSLYTQAFADEHQALICKLLIIREEFPSYHRQLMAKPSLLFKDVADIWLIKEEQRSAEERLILADSRLYAFLLATAGVSMRYEQKEEVVSQILVNTQTANYLPENIRQAYRMANADELTSYAQDSKQRELLLNHLQDNLKKMVLRRTAEAEGKTHIDVLLALFAKGLLTTDDKKRLLEPLESETIWLKLINLYKDKRPLITLGNDLEAIGLSKLTGSLEYNFVNKDRIEESQPEEHVNNVFFAASTWPVERCKNIAEMFADALKEFPVAFRGYEYGKDKFATLFTDEVYKHLIENMSADDCTDEKSAIQTFRHLCHIQAVTKERLKEFVQKATEIAPIFDHSKPQESKPQNYLKALSEVFAELRFLGRVAPHLEMEKLFDKINHQTSHATGNYGRAESKIHSFVLDKSSDEQASGIINSFFANVNLISDGPVISNAMIEQYMRVEASRDKVLDSLMYMKGQGIDVSQWTGAVITDPRRTDIRRIEILKATFVQKSSEGEYEVGEPVVKKEVTELIKLIQAKAEGHEALTVMLEAILEEGRINQLVREVLATKTLEEQKQLPPSLMQRATESFEKHIQELTVSNDLNVLQIIAAYGSDEGIEGVWGIINPLLADGKNQPQKIIDSAVQILLSVKKLTKKQADALTGNVNALPANKVTNEKRKEILKHIEECQESIVNNKGD